MERIDKILKNGDYLKYLEKNRLAEKSRIYCRHDITHFLDTARISYIISLEENYRLNKEVLYAAALLHDIGRWMEYESGIDHAEASVMLAKKILEDCCFSQSESDEILEAIGSHRNRKETSVLGDVLYRADKLSRNCLMCGAISTCKHFQNGEKPILLY
ncbi:MAG: HD domain-containing protein [Sedimentibacter sp.]|uniref:HD domain-containing protein n=1 Tax=Sedimentibacter sp. TaxID=1960295 RepID=UPI00315966C5